jgi:hypothetical protein
MSACAEVAMRETDLIVLVYFSLLPIFLSFCLLFCFFSYILSDIDECTKKTDNCTSNATCNNTAGSYECICDNGFYCNGSNCEGIFITLFACRIFFETIEFENFS